MKKWRSVLAIVLALVMLLAFAACGKDEKPAESPENSAEVSDPVQPSDAGGEENPGEAKRVLFSSMNLSDDQWIYLDGLMREAFEGGGYVYDSISAEMDPIKQIEQVENATVQGYDMIVIVPINGEALSDACQRAMDAGTLIFSFIFDTIARNSYRTTDPVAIAETGVELTMEWAEKTFPDAEDGSINCVVIGSDLDETAQAQWDGAYNKILTYSQVNVIEKVSAEPTVMDGQAKAENILTMHPETEINLWLVTDAAQAVGVNAAIMAENSGVDYKDKVCLMVSNLSEEIAGLMKASMNDESVMRVASAPGGNPVENIQGLFEQADKMLKGESYEALCPVQIDRATAENIADFGY